MLWIIIAEDSKKSMVRIVYAFVLELQSLIKIQPHFLREIVKSAIPPTNTAGRKYSVWFGEVYTQNGIWVRKRVECDFKWMEVFRFILRQYRWLVFLERIFSNTFENSHTFRDILSSMHLDKNKLSGRWHCVTPMGYPMFVLPPDTHLERYKHTGCRRHFWWNYNPYIHERPSTARKRQLPQAAVCSSAYQAMSAVFGMVVLRVPSGSELRYIMSKCGLLDTLKPSGLFSQLFGTSLCKWIQLKIEIWCGRIILTGYTNMCVKTTVYFNFYFEIFPRPANPLKIFVWASLNFLE